MTDPTPLTVAEVTSRIKVVLEGSLPPLWVRGEISQFTRHRSGHWYFTLGDEKSVLPCVLWRGRAAEAVYVPQAGDQVIVNGRITVFERGGRYQFDCFEIRPAGVGQLAQAFEALKRKLDAEGFFALERKIPLPRLPERIGLVTSPEGAALQDILRVAQERAPWVEFLLAPAAVQGVAAAGEIAAAIKALDKLAFLDLIIIGRGGGSAEDLWAFNEEIVVRAVSACETPIVSAVGHEVDVSLSDLAADLRAPTPSAAAEMCLPDKESLRERLIEAQNRLRRSLESRTTEARNWLNDRARTVINQSIKSIWREESQRTDELSRRLGETVSRLIERRKSALERSTDRLNALNPLNVLSRGYAVVKRSGELKAVTSIAQLTEKDLVEITLHHGIADAQIRTLRLL